jgi:CRP-like cAMP-binding protein
MDEIVLTNNLMRKPLIIDKNKQDNIRGGLDKLIATNDSNIISQLHLEKDFKRYDATETRVRKSLNFKAIIAVISKPKHERTKFDIRMLSQFLCERYNFFKKLKDQSDFEKLEALAGVLNLEYYSKGDKIIRYGEEGTKFYVVLKGSVLVTRPAFREVQWCLKEIIIYLNNLKFNEKDERKLKRVEEANVNNLNIKLIRLSDYDYNRIQNLGAMKKFIIEEDIKLAEKEEGEEFGEMALINKTTRNATILANSESIIANIDRSEYNKIIREIDEKLFNAKIEGLKKVFPLISKWSRHKIASLISSFSRVNIGTGEFLCSQNTKADRIFFVLEGQLELNITVNIGNYLEYIRYLVKTKGNILDFIKRNENVEIKDITKYINEIGKYVFKVESTNDPAPNISNDDSNYKRILMMKEKNETLIQFRIKQEELRSNLAIATFKLKNLEKGDVIGLEEAMEMKKRFYSVKCVSATNEIYSISLDVKNIFKLGFY